MRRGLHEMTEAPTLQAAPRQNALRESDISEDKGRRDQFSSIFKAAMKASCGKPSGVRSSFSVAVRQTTLLPFR